MSPIKNINQTQKEAFVQVIDQHKGILYKVAQAYCPDRDERKDLVQEIIFQLWKSFGNYDNRHKVSTWMYRIALNVAISYLRKSQVRSRYHAQFDDQLVQVSEQSEADLSEEVRLLRQFIHQQKKLDKGLLLLYLDGNSHAEIAEVLGLSTSNVGTKLSRLKERLKNYFTQYLK